MPKRALRRIGAVIGAFVVAFLIVVIVIAVVRTVAPVDPLAAGIDHSEYQAVFLTSGEVYFGTLSEESGGFCYLRHVYRLTSRQSAHSKSLQRTLVKLVNDIHSPTDLMIINRNQILYVENLNPAGSAAHLMQRGGP